MEVPIQETRKRFVGLAMLGAIFALVFALIPLQSAHAAGETVTVGVTGLNTLEVGKNVENAQVNFTLAGGTYANPITPGDFTVSGLPAGLTAGAAVRTSDTVVSVPVTGAPTTVNTSVTALTYSAIIPFANITGATVDVVPTGTINAGAVGEAGSSAASWSRLHGTDRYKTMVEIIKAGFQPGDSDTVIIATGENYPDALAASGLAGLLDAPVILTPKAGLADESIKEIERLQPQNAIILGSTAAISSAVMEDLVDRGLKVKRVQGATRIETAVAIYEAGINAGTSWGATKQWGTTAIVASSQSFADALSISSYAYADAAPIFLTDGNGVLTEDVLKALKDGGFTDVLIVGSDRVVAQSVESDQLKTYTVKRLAGPDRYATSLAIAEFAINSNVLSADKMAVATGLNFPDALSGAALCGKNTSVVLLVAENDVAKGYVKKLIDANKSTLTQGYALGSEVVVSQSLFEYIKGLTK